MPDQERKFQNPSPSSDTLELNKETIQDLDVEASDADAVRGGLLRVTLSEGCKIAPKPDSI
jgi:hypothetical protein